MDPQLLIKNKKYLLGIKPGKEIVVEYVSETLNYRVFVTDDGTKIELDETSARNDIKEIGE